jgi:hypothetical protein
MGIIVRLFTLLSPLLQRLGICATTGFIAGAFAGFILWVYAFFQSTTPVLSASDIVKLSLVLTAAAWILILFVLVPLGRLAFLSVWYSSLLNTFLTCLLTVWVVYKLDLWIIAYLVGMIIGVWIGLILCYINNYFKKKTNGVHQ